MTHTSGRYIPKRYSDVGNINPSVSASVRLVYRECRNPLVATLCRVALILLVWLNVAEAQNIETIAQAKPIVLSGGVAASGNYQKSSSSSSTPVQPLSAYLTISPTLSLYDIQLPFSLYLSTTGNQFQQPFNEIGASPTYKWITLHGGYRTMEISPYTLSGVRWLGGGVEANPGYFRMAAMVGRLRKATQGDTLRRVAETFKRDGYAFKLGVGKQNNFVDINFFHAVDDAHGIDTLIDLSGIAPVENTVLSIHPRLNFGAFCFEGEAAGALFNRDSRASSVSDPAIPRQLHLLHTLNTSTRLSWAIKTNAAYRNRIVRLNLKYLRIQPEFQSLGAGYLAPDKEEIALSTSVRIIRDARYTGSVGFRRNNLDNMRLQTTNRLVWSSGIDWQIAPAIGFDARYSNYSAGTSDGLQKIADSLKANNTAHSLSFSPRITVGTTDQPHTIASSVTIDIYDDQNILTDKTSDNRTLSAQVSHSSLLAGTWSSNQSGSFTKAVGFEYDNTVWGTTIGVSNSLLDNKLSYSLGITTSFTLAEGTILTQVFPVANGQYRLNDRNEFHIATQLSQQFEQKGPRTDAVVSAGYTRTF